MPAVCLSVHGRTGRACTQLHLRSYRRPTPVVLATPAAEGLYIIPDLRGQPEHQLVDLQVREAIPTPMPMPMPGVGVGVVNRMWV